MVGNGDELTKAQVCKAVKIEIQGHNSVVDLYTFESQWTKYCIEHPMTQNFRSNFNGLLL